MDYQPPPFFSRGPAPLVRLGFFISLAVLLMVLDARFRYAESIREVFALLAYPLQRVALAPVELLSASADFFTTQVALKRENEQLMYSVPHAAKITDLSPRAMWALVQSGDVESVKIGKARRIKREDLQTWIATLKPAAEALEAAA